MRTSRQVSIIYTHPLYEVDDIRHLRVGGDPLVQVGDHVDADVAQQVAGLRGGGLGGGQGEGQQTQRAEHGDVILAGLGGGWRYNEPLSVQQFYLLQSRDQR